MDPYERATMAVAGLQSNINSLTSLFAVTQRIRQFVLNQGYYTEETLPAILKEARDDDYARGMQLTIALRDLWQAKLDNVDLS